MEFIRPAEMPVLRNPGVESVQLLNPENSRSTRVTLTRVTVDPGHEQPRHTHQTSEQIWIATRGKGLLLVADGETLPFKAGDVARFADGDVHGFQNDSDRPFEYISITSPPIDFGYAYSRSG